MNNCITVSKKDSSKMYKVAPYYDSNYEIIPRNFMYHMPNLSKIGNSTCAKLSGKQAAVKNLENHSQTEYQISDNSEKDEQQDLRLSAINEKIRFVRDMVDKMIKLYGLDISASEKRLFISSAEVKNSEITIERKKDTSLLFLSHDNSKFTDLFKKNCLLGEIIIHIPVFVDPAVICALYLTLACHPAVTLTQCIHSSAISTSIPFYDLFSSLPKHAEGDVQIKVRMMWINKLENFPVVQIDLKKHVICGAVAVLKVLAALAGFHKIYHNPEDAERKMDYWCWAALRYKKDTTNILKMLNTSLTDKCIVGNRLSLADIFMWSQLFMDNSKSKTLHLANIQRWFNNCTRCVPFNDVVAKNMPFLRGRMPIRRTLYYLEKGDIYLREDVKIFTIAFNPVKKNSDGAKFFTFWHWAQLQYKNPYVQFLKLRLTTPLPFVQAFLISGEEVLMDIDGYTMEELRNRIVTILGKTEKLLQYERLTQAKSDNPAHFGEKCARQCICEIQGQRPCSGLLPVPEYLSGRWRWNKNLS
ncbi:putative 28S ribosomal protein S25, mitochondrial [Trichinella pseudospiralis]|uniref:Putative 28S ribosomal protein S25, mitochondrial n=1 Tax=Trichinella pseudospiralis TaxID=6337 RepID=A0A0V1F7P1_TRIPS|nr:putative 28S ribosomal protein S25, mitochondrial [Trichinella pseudospiralis]